MTFDKKLKLRGMNSVEELLGFHDKIVGWPGTGQPNAFPYGGYRDGIIRAAEYEVPEANLPVRTGFDNGTESGSGYIVKTTVTLTEEVGYEIPMVVHKIITDEGKTVYALTSELRRPE